MIPPTIDPSTPSPGERWVFEQLEADESQPDWFVLHSQDIARHRTQTEGEADFIIVAPGLGVLVIEVKGFVKHVPRERKRGLWFYGNDTKGTHRGPFDQAKEAMRSLKDTVNQQRPKLSQVPFFHAVCLPSHTLRDGGTEWEPWQCIDAAKLEGMSLGECLERAFAESRRRLVEAGMLWFHPSRGEPTPEQCKSLVYVLRRDLEVPNATKAWARIVEEQIHHYTKEQFDALDDMRWTDRAVFDGPAGTGKTVLALEQARRRQAAKKSVLFLCFNRALCAWLREEVRAFDSSDKAPPVTVRTVHQYMEELIGTAAVRALRAKADYWDAALPDAAETKLLQDWETLKQMEEEEPLASPLGPHFGIYDELIVDEAQDVVRDCFLGVLDLCVRDGLKGGMWHMFGDFEWQTIYDDTVSLDGFCRTRGGGCYHRPLTKNCRNTPRVAKLACRVGSVAPGYSKMLRADDREEPAIHFYVDEEDQRGRLKAVLDDLRVSGYSGSDVLVLSLHGDDKCIAGTLREQPWKDRLELLVDGDEVSGPVNLGTSKTHYCSMSRAKGLEARAVVLTDVDGLSKKRERSLVYVGVSRATDQLVVLAHEDLRGQLGS